MSTIDNRLPMLNGRNLPVFPCREDKRPACPHGFKDATADPDDAKELLNRYSAPLIGVPTGAISGFDVLDIDPRHGGDDWLELHALGIPLTRIHSAKSGGQHFLFKHQDGLKNSAGKIAAGVDVRADGGYVIWWPANGYNVFYADAFYSWPEWLIEKTKGQDTPVTRPKLTNIDARSSKYAKHALLDACQKLVHAPAGQRNVTLNQLAWSLLRFVKAGELSSRDVIIHLTCAALEAGLSRQETIATLASAFRSRSIAL